MIGEAGRGHVRSKHSACLLCTVLCAAFGLLQVVGLFYKP